MEFGEVRNEESHYETEARLLSMFGCILLEMLTAQGPSSLSLLFTAPEFKPLDPALRSIVEESARAHNRYLEKLHGDVVQEIAQSEVPRKRKTQRPQDQYAVLKDSLTFLRLQTHPYFRTSEVSLQADLEPLVAEFEALEKVANRSFTGETSFNLESSTKQA